MTKDTTKDNAIKETPHRSEKANPFSSQHFEEMEVLAKTKGGKEAQKVFSNRQPGMGSLFSRSHFEEIDQQVAKIVPGNKVVPREEDEKEEAACLSKRRSKTTDQRYAEGSMGEGHRREREFMTDDEGESEGESEYFSAPSPCLEDDRAPKRVKIDEKSRQDEEKEDMSVDENTMDEKEDMSMDENTMDEMEDMSVDEDTMDEDMESENGEDENEEPDDEELENNEERMEPDDEEEESVGEDNMDEDEEFDDEEHDEESENDEEDGVNEENVDEDEESDEELKNGDVTNMEEDNMNDDEDEDVQEITPIRSRSSAPHVMEHNSEEPVLINSTSLSEQQRQSNQAVVTPSPKGFMDYLAPEGTTSTRPVYKFSDLPNKLVLEIFELLHDENDPKPVSSICFGLTCKSHWGWFKQRWCIPFSEYSIYEGYLPKEDQALLAPLLQDWVPNNYRMMSGIGGKGGPSIVPMFLSRKVYGESYSREEERLENRYNACFSIIDAENQDGMRLISSRGFQTVVDNTIDLPNPHGMGHSWYDAAASEYLLKVETWEWSTLNGDGPGYKAICDSWHSFTKTSLWDWVNGKGFNQFQEDWMDNEGMEGRKEIKEVLINFDKKVTRFELSSGA